MILGIDVGYSMTKTCSSKGIDIFMSTVEEGVNDINKAIVIEYEGIEYTIGEKTGAFSTDINKINDLTFKLCLFTAISRAMKNNLVDEINLVTGLPIEYYKTQKQELVESLKGVRATVIYNGEPKRFTITNCLVFPQSAGLFVLNPSEFVGDNIIVDIGGLTVDVSYFNDMKLLKSRTYELGILKLYDKIIQIIKSIYGVSYDILKAESIIYTGNIIKDGNTINVKELVDEILKKHTENILRNIKNGLSEYDTSKRIFIGGGSYILKDYLPVKIKQEDIYANAKAFYLIGVDKFE
ncbi:ParM/StbA family protein [Clostridium sp. SYSU_GA19001]|uniref:ParM/StbA family protein n=1 Tax=Clostridium caldaquaticum TaxID=2940653 RepID=UPI002076EEEB|nr:ParM/StbA family protein [Clostridium caldaquaticum]MCM8710555.1 ParM/StbA family protein [Clostridium caldaquaticum]